ncbi:MAG TPA: alpha/beta hydrolase [Mycobacteriales bacterium]|nr:alpha/beta hydrolase [Mycobacteriales bacterium]
MEPFYAGGTGSPLVLLHGFTDTWRTWKPVLPALEARHAVFAPSLPGHLGGEQFAPGASFTVAASLDLIERQLDAKGIEKAHLVGNSLGGWGALELACRGRALSVVAICPGGGYELGSREERAVLRYFRNNERMLRLPAAKAMLPRIARSPALRRVAFRDLLARPSNLGEADAMAFFEGAAGCTVARAAITLSESGEAFGDLGPIDCPVRILYGTRDRIIRWPTHYRRLKSMLPAADYVPLHGLGHLPMWDDPETVSRRILEVTAPNPVAA